MDVDAPPPVVGGDHPARDHRQAAALGQGSVSPRAYLAELPSLVAEIDAGTIAVSARPVPLADVEAAWTAPEPPGQRTVLIP